MFITLQHCIWYLIYTVYSWFVVILCIGIIKTHKEFQIILGIKPVIFGRLVWHLIWFKLVFSVAFDHVFYSFLFWFYICGAIIFINCDHKLGFWNVWSGGVALLVEAGSIHVFFLLHRSPQFINRINLSFLCSIHIINERLFSLHISYPLIRLLLLLPQLNDTSLDRPLLILNLFLLQSGFKHGIMHVGAQTVHSCCQKLVGLLCFIHSFFLWT